MDYVAAIASDGIDQEIVKVRSDEDAKAAELRVQNLLRRPFSPGNAVQIALLNNKGASGRL